MQKGFAPIIVLLMVLLVASTAGVTYYFTKSQTLSPVLQSISQPQSTPTPIMQLQDNFSDTTENNYINKQMGISLTIPSSWQGKYKDELLVADPSEDLKIGSLMTVNFVYLGSKQKYTLFSIHQFPVQDWKRKGFTERKLGEKDNYVYYYTYSLDNPFIGIEADEYQSMSADINKILSTFEFLEGNTNSSQPSLQEYRNKEAGFILQYPDFIKLTEPSIIKGLTINISATKIEDLNNPSGYDKETAIRDKVALEKGNYGENIDWPLLSSRKVIRVGEDFGKDFVVLGRFETCDVVFERILIFYNNNYQVRISLLVPAEEVMTSMPQYFKKDTSGCGSYLAWDFDKQDDFYQTLVAKKGSPAAQRWFDVFDDIVKTVQLY